MIDYDPRKKVVFLPQAVETEKASILVIDDDQLLRRSLKKLLERERYFVDLAQNGEEGILKAKSGFFDLILCDIRMPGLDGLMTLERIQEFQARSPWKSGCIVITAYDSPDTRSQAFRLGVTDHLTKPFDLGAFLEKINFHLETLKRPSRTPREDLEKFTFRFKGLVPATDDGQGSQTRRKGPISRAQ